MYGVWCKSDILCMKSFRYKQQDKYVSPSCTESNKEVRKYILTILSIITEIEAECPRNTKEEYKSVLGNGEGSITKRMVLVLSLKASAGFIKWKEKKKNTEERR